MKRRLSIAALVACLVITASGQQPNGPSGRFLLGGFDNGNYPLTPPLFAPGVTTFNFRGAANAPFILAVGAESPNFLDLGAIGRIDIDLAGPDFAIWADGVTPVTGLDQMAVLDGQGVLDVTIPLASHQVGNLGTGQVIFASPASAQGWSLSAANNMIAAPGMILSSVTPSVGTPNGGMPVQIIGEGFIVGHPVNVFFGTNLATAATVTSTTTIDCLTPPGAPGQAASIVVVMGDLVATLPSAYSYSSTVVASGPVIINEVFTGSPDYVEIVNPHTVPVDVSGFRMRSWYYGTTLDGEFVLPQGTVLAPGDTLLIQEGGVAGAPASLPNSIHCGYNLFWVGSRQIEVAIFDPFDVGVDYVTRRYNGTYVSPNLPANLSWSGDITGIQDALQRSSLTDTNQAGDFSASSHGSPGVLNPGQ